jgi:hypothetical protein
VTATVPTSTIDRTTIGFRNVLTSEFTKLRSVRSTYWTTASAMLGALAVSVIVCVQYRTNLLDGKDSLAGFDAPLTSLNGIYLAQIAVGTLGVLAISSEYATGMIRATFGAVPQRRVVLAAKGIVFAACTLAVGEVLSFTAFGIGQTILAPTHGGASISNHDALRATVGGGLYLTAVGLLGFGLGALIRHTAGGLAAFFGLLFASTALVDLLPTTWRNHLINYLPANAGSQILTTVGTRSPLGPWTGLGVLCLYAAAAIAVAVLLVDKRDA